MHFFNTPTCDDVWRNVWQVREGQKRYEKEYEECCNSGDVSMDMGGTIEWQKTYKKYTLCPLSHVWHRVTDVWRVRDG